MRFTQFGHHVPRRNSIISVPCASRPPRVNVPSRLAAPREKSGAREPISRVSVRFFMSISTLSEVEVGNNNGWGSGLPRRSSDWAGPSALTGSFRSDIIQLLTLKTRKAASVRLAKFNDDVSKSIRRIKDALMPLTSIADIRGRQVLDSRGNPTVEAEVFLDGGGSRLGKSMRTPTLSLPGRSGGERVAGADDEYLERRRACRQQRRFPGVHGDAGGSAVVFRGAALGRGSLPHAQGRAEKARLQHGGRRRRRLRSVGEVERGSH